MTHQSQTQNDAYAQMDREAVAEFVRWQLIQFPLSQAEACVICDANNGAMMLPGFWSGLWCNILDTPAKSLSQKWECDAEEVAQRIRHAQPGVQFALGYAVAQFWRNCEKPTEEALALAGFFIRDRKN